MHIQLPPKLFKHLIVLFVLGTILNGCAVIRPDLTLDEAPATKDAVFSHDRFDAMLARAVDNQGRVDYTLLRENAADLDAYLLRVAAYSPDSHPAMFPTQNHKLAYWLNAYNAYVIKAVLVHYPIKSVLDVNPPALLFFLPDTFGFFIFQRFEFGGETTNLYYLGNDVVRERFQDPRVHFALNCASISCPHLPRYAFTGDRLDDQLNAETLEFLTDDRNVRIDHENKTIWLSSIFKWYASDFEDPAGQAQKSKDSPLVAYLLNHLPPGKADDLKAVANQYAIKFIPYDWGLNDRA